METSHAFSTIDTHTAGEPTRIVTDGLRLASGPETVEEYRTEFRENHDWIRELLLKEPRGHDDMFGAVPVPSSHPEADLGVFFLTNEGYIDMCGHATIGVVTAFLELGRLPVKETVVLETPAGLIEAEPDVRNRTVERVQFRNVESFVYDSCTVSLDTGSSVHVDVVYGGNFFAMVDVRDVDASVSPGHSNRLVDLGLEIRRNVNESLDVRHPFTGEPAAVKLTEFYDSTAAPHRNLTVFGTGSIDRSPCGSGTCAKMALLQSTGDLGQGEPYPHRSVIDTEFEGEIEAVRSRDGYDVVVPTIRGSAYVIARNEFVLDPDDPLVGFNVTGNAD